MAKRNEKPKSANNQSVDALSGEMGEKLREARVGAGLTQTELAEQTGRRQASISEMENGKMDISSRDLLRLAYALNKPVTFFFPQWLLENLHPEQLSPAEAELLSLAKRLETEDLHRLIIQIRALADHNHRKWLELADHEFER